MKFTLKKIFLVAFILCLVGILLWMFFSKFKEGNFDCGDLKEKKCNDKNGCIWKNNKCELNNKYNCFTNAKGDQRNKEECDGHPYGCEWKKKSGHKTSACYLKGTV
jgi:hypothetical protein